MKVTVREAFLTHIDMFMNAYTYTHTYIHSQGLANDGHSEREAQEVTLKKRTRRMLLDDEDEDENKDADAEDNTRENVRESAGEEEESAPVKVKSVKRGKLRVLDSDSE